MVSVLCVAPGSNYFQLAGVDLWDAERDAYNFTGSNPVIAHPPCAQWSRMRAFAKENKRERELAFFCLEKIQANGGILEHPAGSAFFKAAGIRPTLAIDQKDFGFAARKTTYLYFHGVKPLPVPLTFEPPARGVKDLHSAHRSIMPVDFCRWLVAHF